MVVRDSRVVRAAGSRRRCGGDLSSSFRQQKVWQQGLCDTCGAGDNGINPDSAAPLCPPVHGITGSPGIPGLVSHLILGHEHWMRVFL
ncbi:hypothetical protein J6590_090185 [Homalodisca vitripennis]|nr:hypothetical protein J6590_090185 [Homalodisca vitripennis]